MSQLILPGTAGPGDVRAGKNFCAGVNYNVAGTAADKTGAGVVLTPGAAPIAIPAGIYGGLTTDGEVAAVAVTAAHLLAGDTVAGTAGAMPNNGAPTWTPTSSPQNLSAGYYSGGTIQGANLQPKLDSYYKNFPSSGYYMVSYIEGEGLYAVSTSIDGKLYLLNSSGTIINTISCSAGSNARAIHVSKNYILWDDAIACTHLWVSNKSGTATLTISMATEYGTLGCISENASAIYHRNDYSGNGWITCYNFSGTKLTTDGTAIKNAVAFIPSQTGAFIVNPSAAGTCTLDFYNTSGGATAKASMNVRLTNDLFSSY